MLLLVPAHSSLRGEGRASRAACVVGAGECRVCSHTLDMGPCCSLLRDAPARSAPGEGLGSHATSSQGRAQNPKDKRSCAYAGHGLPHCAATQGPAWLLSLGWEGSISGLGFGVWGLG